ncbi:hypothetical protein BJY04DRAFT_215911 [Aspergillus karnatakaensis]|uniref:uncharacterized protein n=1 Tax=Aspergillus karnatakaensis TaxID=1810916 RepID=UPI003CCC90DD
MAGFACDVAATAINAETGPLEALNMLEQGRGVLGTSLQELRADIADLKRIHPDLAEQSIRLRNTLEPPISDKDGLVLAETEYESPQDLQTRQRLEINDELDRLIANIRGHAGFENFLCAPTEKEMQLAAKYGPIVVINVSQYRCDAILVQQNQVTTLPLLKLKWEALKEKAALTTMTN